MSEEVKPIIKVDIGDSQKTVKQLKDEINILRDHILNLEQGTEEYDSAVKKLQDDQRQLNSVMALSKREATALDGSYDSLTHQMSLLKKEWKATNDEAQRAVIGQQIAEINTQLKEMDAEIGNFQRNVGNYQSALDGVNASSVSFGEAMSKMNQQIEPTKQKFESVGKIAGGIASGFAAVQGAAALLGIENDNLEKSLVKVQSAMAIAQGISGLGGLVEGLAKAKVAFQGVNTTIQAVNKTMGKTGWLLIITLVVTAIVGLISILKKKREEVNANEEAIKRLTKAEENFETGSSRRSKKLEREIKLMKAKGATDIEVANKRIEANKRELEEAQRIYDEANKQYLAAKNRNEMGIRSSTGKKTTDEDVAAFKEQTERALEILTEYKEKHQDLLTDLEVAQINYNNKNKIEPPKLPVLDDIEIEDEEIVVEDETAKLQEEGEYYKRKSAAFAAIEKTYTDLARKNKEDASNYEVTIEERKLAKIKELHQQAVDTGDYTSQVLLAQEIADQELAVEEAKYAEEERMRQENLAAEEAAAQKRIEITNKVASALSAAGSVTQGILEITQAAAEKDGEITEKEAKKIKGMQIAVATMNMLAGITAAISGCFTTKTGPWDIAMAAIQAASIAAAGTANIMKIKNTDLTGSVSSGAQAAVTPNSNIYGTDLPMSYVRNVTTASEVDALNQDTRVYILESDIQASNKKVSVRESESTF